MLIGIDEKSLDGKAQTEGMAKRNAKSADPASSLLLSAGRSVTTRLRRFRGGLLLGEAFRRINGRRPRLIRVGDFDGTLKMDLDLAEHMQGQIFWHGFYSLEIVHLLKNILRRGDTFIDCGANVGELTLVASKLVGEEGRVISFEPLDGLANQLEHNLELNEVRNVELQRLGLSDARGSAPLFVRDEPFMDGTDHRGLGTLFVSPDRAVEAGVIKLDTLDSVLGGLNVSDIAVIKLDIEGAELPALKGARETVERFSPSLIVEIGRDTCRSAGYEPEELYSFLSSFGYRISRIGRRGSLQPIAADELADWQNVYCVRNPRSG